MTKKKSQSFVITIDGPAGSGKSTVSVRLAQRLQLSFLTTGAFYRGIAFLAQKRNTDLGDEDALVHLTHDPGFSIVANPDGTKVFVDAVDVTTQINNEEVGKGASRISTFSRLREALLEAQRSFDREPGLIAEGRDCGTVVFPNAVLKIFLTASLESRAARRSTEYQTNSKQSQKELSERDERDSQRKVAPMAKAADAIEIDTSLLSIDDVVDRIEKLFKERKSR